MSTMDSAFDELVLPELRHLSHAHWTPVEVAIRATALLSPTPHMRVLDVGAGVGKLCAVGALSSNAVWYGVEQHEELVNAARRLTRALGIANRTQFLHGDVFAIDWSDFDALYLYNPFELPLFPHTVTAQEQCALVQGPSRPYSRALGQAARRNARGDVPRLRGLNASDV
ncbi:MAG TPA: methyltransferase domain-containing protein [Gemmatimonadaceae bacterium]